MPTSWKVMGVLGLIAVIACFCLYGMSTAGSSMRPCPICGKETSSSLIAEQGACNECYSKAEENNNYYSNRNSSDRSTDQYDYYFRDAEEQQRRDDEYERRQEEEYERLHEEGYL